MTENRIHTLRSISQQTGEYNDDLITLDDFGALLVDVELEESPILPDRLLGLQTGQSVRFGGGAEPLMELTRIA